MLLKNLRNLLQGTRLRPCRRRSRAFAHNAAAGTLESLEARLLLAADFGDAPLPYPVTLAEGGAQHEEGGPTLGATVDTEADGTHSAAADADGADDDGVTFGTVRVGQVDATVTVNVQNAPSGAKLDAWIDFNRDGHWGGAGEQIFDTVDVVNGDNVLTFDVPPTAVSGGTFARFRLSTAGDLGHGGMAADGEVEDLAIAVSPPVAIDPVFGNPLSIHDPPRAGSIEAGDLDGDGDADLIASYSTLAWYENIGGEFVEHVVDTAGTANVFLADLDLDGDLDIVTDGKRITWFENDGYGAFTRHVVFINPFSSSSSAIFVVDIDSDGDMDLIHGTTLPHELVCFENDGSAQFTRRIVTTDAGQVVSIAASDVDGDGDIDLLSGSFDSTSVFLHENTGAQGFVSRVVATTAPGVTRVHAADVDSDGDTDVVVGSSGDSSVRWLENDGSGAFTEHLLATDLQLVNAVMATDFDADGDIDILAASTGTHGVTIFKNGGSQTFVQEGVALPLERGIDIVVADFDGDSMPDFTVASRARFSGASELTWYRAETPGSYVPYKRITGIDDPRALQTIDLDGDGDLDVVSASAADDRIAWHENNGDQSFQLHTISTAHDVAEAVHVADLDGDGDVDVLSAASRGGILAWHENDGMQNFTTHVITTNAYAAVEVTTADIDGDGDLDIVGAAANNAGLGWYENDGQQNFAQHVVAEGYPPISIYYGRHAVPIDLDQDGDLDLLSTIEYLGVIEWFRNDGTGQFERLLVADNLRQMPDAKAADVDGDGDLDIVSGAPGAVATVAWYENDGDENFSVRQVTDEVFQGFRSPGTILLADIDGDADPDILTSGFTATNTPWFRNDGNGVFTRLPLGNQGQVADFDVADFDRDGDLDFVTVRGHSIIWLPNVGPPEFLDYGDAAESFGVTKGDDGPRHGVVPGVFLGSNIDAEADGIPDIDALSDDNDGTDDGAFFPAEIATGPSEFDVIASTDGFVSAWIDLNHSGTFDAVELVAAGRAVTAGRNTLRMSVNSVVALPGPAAARVRFTSFGVPYPIPTGLQLDGEVEDSIVTIRQARPYISLPVETITENALFPLPWTAVANAVSYEVWYTNVTIGQAPYINETAVAGTTFTPSTPLEIGRYFVWVRANLAGGGHSDWSAPVKLQVNTRATLHSLPFHATNSTPTVSWDALPGADHYELWVNNVTTGQSQVLRDANISGTSFTPPTDLGFGVHRIWVRGIDAMNRGAAWSDPVDVLVGPELLTPVNPTFDQTPTFEWTSLAGIASYEIYVQTTGGVVREAGLTTTTWTPSANLAQGIIRWWIRASADSGATGPWSAAVNSQIGGRTTVQSPVGMINDTTPLFTWLQVDGAARYILHVERVGAGLAFRDDNVLTTSFTPTAPLTPGNYRVWVKAISAADNVSGFWSNPVDFTIADVDRGNLLGRELPRTLLDLGEERESKMRPAVALIVDSQEVADDREQTRQQRDNAAIADRPSSLPVQEDPSPAVVPWKNASAEPSATAADLTGQVMTERLMADLGWLDQE